MDLAEYPEPCDATVGIDVEAQMGPDLRAGHMDQVMRIAGKGRRVDDFLPVGLRVRHRGFAGAGLEGRGRGVVSGEMAGVDVDRENEAGPPETKNGVIVSGSPFAAALPAVHPFAVVVVEVGIEDRRRGIDHAGLVGKEIVRGVDDLRAQAGVRQIDKSQRKGFDLGAWFGRNSDVLRHELMFPAGL